MQSRTLLICLVVTYSCILSINALVAGGNNMWNGDAPSLKKEVIFDWNLISLFGLFQ